MIVIHALLANIAILQVLHLLLEIVLLVIIALKVPLLRLRSNIDVAPDINAQEELESPSLVILEHIKIHRANLLVWHALPDIIVIRLLARNYHVKLDIIAQEMTKDILAQ